ncbi:MAG: MFS transporter, partial [Rhodospirillaceae bacterium]|nr:MFS transporter [Rhodospirillaceae bacterium]
MLIIFMIVFIDLVGFGIVIPLLPFYGEHFQADPFTVSMLMATYSLGQFIAAPLWGRLSDSMGRRPILLISLVGSVFSYSLLAYASSLWILFIARAIGGLMAGNISTAFAGAVAVGKTRIHGLLEGEDVPFYLKKTRPSR